DRRGGTAARSPRGGRPRPDGGPYLLPHGSPRGTAGRGGRM
ncbi:MAG: hypothetical protein AVDCRST_MAG12-151, partial [uncultured Rubrobacteraceae bacterium]